MYVTQRGPNNITPIMRI